MTSQPPLGPDDARQPDALDDFLDGLADGKTVPPRDLDPTLAATVRHVQRLASESVVNDLHRAGKAHRWEHLMQRQNQNRIAHANVRPFPMTATLPSSSVPGSVPLRSAAQQSRLRRLGGQSLGLVATLTLVLLIAASGLALYVTAPRGGDEPTMLPAAIGANLQATPSDSTAVPADLVYPVLPACTVQPRTVENVLSVLAAPLDERTVYLTLPSSFQRHPAGGAEQAISLYSIDIPEGPAPDQATIEAVSATFGQFQACDRLQERLRLTALFTDSGLVLRNWIDGQPDGIELIRLLQEPIPAESAIASIGQPSVDALWGFRVLDDGRIAAWILAIGDADLGLLPMGQDFVVFALENGVWRIDEIRGPSRG